MLVHKGGQINTVQLITGGGGVRVYVNGEVKKTKKEEKKRKKKFVFGAGFEPTTLRLQILHLAP